MEIDETNFEENLQSQWNFEANCKANIDISEINENKVNHNIFSKKRTDFQKSKCLNNFEIYELEEPRISLNLSDSSLDDQNDIYFSKRKSKDVMKVQRPFSSQSKKIKRLTLFQPSPQPPKLTGPVTYYRDNEKIDKRLQREFDKMQKSKEIKRQMKSPYKINFVRLRADSVRSTRNQLQKNEKISRKKRWNESKAYRKACEEEIESERRNSKIDYVSKTYHELRIIRI